MLASFFSSATATGAGRSSGFAAATWLVSFVAVWLPSKSAKGLNNRHTTTTYVSLTPSFSTLSLPFPFSISNLPIATAMSSVFLSPSTSALPAATEGATTGVTVSPPVDADPMTAAVSLAGIAVVSLDGVAGVTVVVGRARGFGLADSSSEEEEEEVPDC